MAKGKDSPYSDTQHKWLITRLPVYLAKTGVGKRTNGDAKGVDDADLTDWVGSRWDEFVEELAEDMTKLRTKLNSSATDEKQVSPLQ